MLFVVPAILFGQSAFASQHFQYYDMSSNITESLVSAALKIYHSENKSGVVTVVDKGGNLVALQRDDNTDSHNTFYAQKKACAVHQKRYPGTQPQTRPGTSK